MSNEKTVALLGAAYRTEINGYFFYTTAASLTADAKGKNIFNQLAKEELEHVGVLSALADSLKGGSGWKTYDDALKSRVATSKGAPIFDNDGGAIDRLRKGFSDQNAVRMAAESEEKAVEFYSDLLKQATEPTEKTVLIKILEMEKNHLKILRWEAESLANTGFWCGNLEFSVEKESD